MARIVWSDKALTSLESIGDYYISVAPAYATAIVPALFEAVDTLSYFPNLGRRVAVSGLERFREILFFNYRIVYLVEQDVVTILDVYHVSMDSSSRMRRELEES